MPYSEYHVAVKQLRFSTVCSGLCFSALAGPRVFAAYFHAKNIPERRPMDGPEHQCERANSGKILQKLDMLVCRMTEFEHFITRRLCLPHQGNVDRDLLLLRCVARVYSFLKTNESGERFFVAVCEFWAKALLPSIAWRCAPNRGLHRTGSVRSGSCESGSRRPLRCHV